MLRNSNKILSSNKATERRQGRSPGEALQGSMKAKDIRITDNILLDCVLTPHEFFFYYKEEVLEAVRSGKWKLRIAGQSSPALYNLKDDIGETTNVLSDHPEIAALLEAKLMNLKVT